MCVRWMRIRNIGLYNVQYASKQEKKIGEQWEVVRRAESRGYVADAVHLSRVREAQAGQQLEAAFHPRAGPAGTRHRPVEQVVHQGPTIMVCAHLRHLLLKITLFN